jgi:hypothetical protein
MVGDDIFPEHHVDIFFASIVWNTGSALNPTILLMAESEH